MTSNLPVFFDEDMQEIEHHVDEANYHRSTSAE
jgi:hypothetical protein